MFFLLFNLMKKTCKQNTYYLSKNTEQTVALFKENSTPIGDEILEIKLYNEALCLLGGVVTWL